MSFFQPAYFFERKEANKNDAKHRWRHVEAVLKRALQIAKHFENVDYEALKLAAFFHDIDYTAYETHVENSIRVAQKFLRKNHYPEDRIKKVTEIMLNHSTPHRKKVGDAKLLEGKIIYDADKSIFITDKETYEKYYPKLYLKETKKLVQKQP